MKTKLPALLLEGDGEVLYSLKRHLANISQRGNQLIPLINSINKIILDDFDLLKKKVEELSKNDLTISICKDNMIIYETAEDNDDEDINFISIDRDGLSMINGKKKEDFLKDPYREEVITLLKSLKRLSLPNQIKNKMIRIFRDYRLSLTF